jgi:hypothetical protein
MSNGRLPYSPDALRRTRTAWAWVLVLAVLLKAAVPMLAATAAQLQGAAMADVCSVYGVRSAPSPSAAPAELAAGAESHAHSDKHCVLTPLLGASTPLPTRVAARLTAQLAAAPERPAPLAAAPHDASQRWLAHRLHAPPARVA